TSFPGLINIVKDQKIKPLNRIHPNLRSASGHSKKATAEQYVYFELLPFNFINTRLALIFNTNIIESSSLVHISSRQREGEYFDTVSRGSFSARLNEPIKMLEVLRLIRSNDQYIFNEAVFENNIYFKHLVRIEVPVYYNEKDQEYFLRRLLNASTFGTERFIDFDKLADLNINSMNLTRATLIEYFKSQGIFYINNEPVENIIVEISPFDT
ncbi:MAG TPA: hypothetical protein PLJ21_03205, partial [Pseudobdellovibrionaceae bacterium]|nr:hypothetical protein [Pseudobdellovibrionaceae bacterium]